ncbi:MAG TPA: A24 family peptidase C-terminal domain-containing protein [Methanobacteriaceae archaeon]|nr:A24 family peptidase C-terminal domain-containing protein [Methanobacteriaceae archaeon]
MINMPFPIPLLTTILAIAACLYASYTDMTKGIIPNKLTFPLIGIGIALNGIYAFLIGNPWYWVSCLIITGVIFGLGYLFWKMGAWAGGDVKLFTALAALIPFYPALISYSVFSVNFPLEASYPFTLTIIINSILSILPFLLLYVLFVSVKTKPHLLGKLIAPIKAWKKNVVYTLVITSAVTFTIFITQQIVNYHIILLINYQIILLSLILIYLLSLVISKLPNQVKAVLISVVTVFALFYNFKITLISMVILFVSIMIIEIIKQLLTTVSKEALQDDYSVKDLRDGMILAYNLYQKEDEVYWDEKSFFQRISEAFKKKDMTLINPYKGKLLISSLAAGLTEEDIKLLKKLQMDEKIKINVRIKRGVPFAPSIFIGLLISLFIGDLAFILQQILYKILY